MDIKMILTGLNHGVFFKRPTPFSIHDRNLSRLFLRLRLSIV